MELQSLIFHLSCTLTGSAAHGPQLDEPTHDELHAAPGAGRRPPRGNVDTILRV